MDQQSIKKLVNKLVEDKLKQLCEECRKSKIQNKLSYHTFNISYQPKNTTFNLDLSQEIYNKENVISNRNIIENRIKSSKSQQLDLYIFNADISAIRPISQISSPTVKAARKKSIQLVKKESCTTYEKVLKQKK